MIGKVLNYRIRKRTFEGKTDIKKNDNPLTSKYMPSKKYVAYYDVQWEHGGISEVNKCFDTQKEAIEEMEMKIKCGIVA
jgi:hypothetical protein